MPYVAVTLCILIWVLSCLWACGLVSAKDLDDQPNMDVRRVFLGVLWLVVMALTGVSMCLAEQAGVWQ